jgi:hypothetical protein
MWRSEAAVAGEPCWIVPFAENEFLTTDGHRGLTRWRWADAMEWKATVGPWTLREKTVLAPLVFSTSANEKRIVVADTLGNVSLLDADAVGEPLQRWRGDEADAENPIPPGVATTNLLATSTPDGQRLIVYSVANKHLVAVRPTDAKPAWVVKRPAGSEFLGGIGLPGYVLMTDQFGTVTAFESASGGKLGTVRPENKELLPRTVATPFGEQQLILPMWDGSVVFLPNPGK